MILKILADSRQVKDRVDADFGEFCGINDCFRPRLCSTVCSVCRSCWVPCIVECTCGPCNQGPIIGGGLQRFGGLGG